MGRQALSHSRTAAASGTLQSCDLHLMWERMSGFGGEGRNLSHLPELGQRVSNPRVEGPPPVIGGTAPGYPTHCHSHTHLWHQLSSSTSRPQNSLLLLDYSDPYHHQMAWNLPTLLPGTVVLVSLSGVLDNIGCPSASPGWGTMIDRPLPRRDKRTKEQSMRD